MKPKKRFVPDWKLLELKAARRAETLAIEEFAALANEFYKSDSLKNS